MILKKDWFSDLEIIKIYGQINNEEYEQDLSTRIETQKIKSHVNKLKSKILIIKKTIDPKTTKQKLWQNKNKFRVKENLDWKEKFILPFLRNQNRKNQGRKKKETNYYQTSQWDNIAELKELIYVGVKLVFDKIGVPPRNMKRNTKPGWEIRLEGQAK